MWQHLVVLLYGVYVTTPSRATVLFYFFYCFFFNSLSVMPAKASLYNMKADPIFDFGTGPRNLAYFSPHGSDILLEKYFNLELYEWYPRESWRFCEANIWMIHHSLITGSTQKTFPQDILEILEHLLQNFDESWRNVSWALYYHHPNARMT